MDDETKKDLFMVMGFLVLLGVVWYATGGPMRQSSMSGPFLQGRPEEKYQDEFVKKSEQMAKGTLTTTSADGTTIIEVNSQYKDAVTIHNGSAYSSDKPQDEYIEIWASDQNKDPINVSNWTVENKAGLKMKIGQASYLPYPSQINTYGDIFLKPNEKVIILTGQSPIGTNFHINKCVGYFAQFQNFTPGISRDCPRINKEQLPRNLNDKCLDYIDSVYSCQIILSPSFDLSSECRDFLTKTTNYNFCVNTHKGDENFYEPEWRVYLNRDAEIWKSKRETITLRDDEGKVVNWYTY